MSVRLTSLLVSTAVVHSAQNGGKSALSGGGVAKCRAVLQRVKIVPNACARAP